MAKPPSKPAPKRKATPRKATKAAPKSKLQKVQIASPVAEKPKAARKSPSAKAPARKNPSDRRGCPKGKGVAAGRNGGQIGQPPFVATVEQRKLVETHAAVGTPHEIIAELLGISSDTLVRHFEKELRLGLIKVNARIGAQVAKKALEGSAKHEFFWLKTRGGYKMGMAIEHAGPNGGPIPHSAIPNVNLSKLSKAELRDFERLAAKASPDADPAS